MCCGILQQTRLVNVLFLNPGARDAAMLLHVLPAILFW